MLAQKAQDSRMKQMGSVYLLTTGEGEANDAAIDVLSALPDLNYQVFYCSPSAAAWFECPFVRDEQGRSFFGVEGIREFVEERKLA